ncbi:MAG: YihA family ribosome biogenesis GTP-binding protein [Bacteroidales bacterium]|nr:YihA family ribosome biogenesis GTP-binding protein [Bacteroidales bacterium]
MEISKAVFIKSSPDYKVCPEPDLPEFAFIGRSNVGKSSLINMLTGRKKLAKISGTPGKTQLINHFLINDTWYLVDLPGYGFAKKSKKIREQWEKMIFEYVGFRENLKTTFILIDSRIPPQQIDLELINWFGSKGLPFVLVFTKTDKISNKRLQENLDTYRETLMAEWEELPLSIISSATTGKGREELLGVIAEMGKKSD